MQKKSLFLFSLLVAIAGKVNAMEGNTKLFVDACMESGQVVSGVIVGPEAEHIRKQTKSDEPIYIRVSRAEEVKNPRDISCARYRVAYTQSNIMGKDGKRAKEPYSFGYDISMCADGLPNELPEGMLK